MTAETLTTKDACINDEPVSKDFTFLGELQKKEGFEIQGEIHKTGVVLLDPKTGQVIGALPNPAFVPKQVENEKGKMELVLDDDGMCIFGGEHHVKMIEYSLMREFGPEGSRELAALVLDHLKTRGLESTAKQHGFLTTGLEVEGLKYSKDGRPETFPSSEQTELQSNMTEKPIDVKFTPRDQAIATARTVLDMDSKYPDSIMTRCSFGILGAPGEHSINSGASKRYILPVNQKILAERIAPIDPQVQEFWDSIARKHGYADLEHLKDSKKDISFMTYVAAHVSLGIAHKTTEIGTTACLEHAIAVADFVNSDFGTVLELITFSTPLIYSTRVGVTFPNEEMKRYPKDVRAIARRVLTTTGSSDFIRDTKNLAGRLKAGILEGHGDRLDRLAFTARVPTSSGEEVWRSLDHGRLRLRQSAGAVRGGYNKMLGRIEFTGCGSTPDQVALAGRNAFYQLMGIAAIEATAAGKTPMEHFGGSIPSAKSCARHDELTMAYNFYGASHNLIVDLVRQGKVFISTMRKKYVGWKDVEYIIDLAEIGLDKLTESTANDLVEFLEDPRGNISDVISRMFEKESDLPDKERVLKIGKAIHDYEVRLSRDIIEANGDIVMYYREKINKRSQVQHC